MTGRCVKQPMYKLNYTPIKLKNFNDYFVRYKDTKDITFINEFLHFYEPVLERKIYKFCWHYGIAQDREEDLKQIFVVVLLEELQDYKSEMPVLQLIKYKVLDAWHDYVRTNCGNVAVDNANNYKTIRKVAFLYYRQAKEKPFDELVSEIAKELNISESNVRKCILASERFKQDFNLDIDDQANEQAFYSQVSQKDLSTLSPEKYFFRNQQCYDLCEALQSLKAKDRKLIELVFGICPSCLMDKKRKTLREASLLLGLTESGAEQKLKRILKKLRNAMQN